MSAPFSIHNRSHSRGSEANASIDHAMMVDPTRYLRIGTLQYSGTLPLQEREVVLTFDDGPHPTFTCKVLDALALERVKATFFLIGAMAQKYPLVVRRIYRDGHTVASHTQHHCLPFSSLSQTKAEQEIEMGITSIGAALGDVDQVAPFFRFPGLARSTIMENYLQTRSISIWSADVAVDDWKQISAIDVLDRAQRRIMKKGKGIILLHDIHHRTAMALPTLLRNLKQCGYRMRHAIPLKWQASKLETK
jgi:peptidoglycan-N-acetylglucosamine deacetylase